MVGKHDAHGFSQGDVMRRLAELERQVQQVQTARRLESASIGSGGLRIHSGGGIVVQGADGGGDVFRVNSDPVELFLRPELIEALSVEIFAARIHTDYVEDQETTTSGSYEDLATVGPVVSNVPISASGKAVVWMAAVIEANCASPSGGGVTVTADMGFEVSGATSQSPGALGQFLMQGNFDAAEETSNVARLGITSVATDLNEGLHTFTAKYRRVQGTAPVPFAERTLVVLAL